MIDAYGRVVNLFFDDTRWKGAFEQFTQRVVKNAAFANDSGTAFGHYLREHEFMIALANTF